MKTSWMAAVCVALAGTIGWAAEPAKLTVQVNKPGTSVSPALYGIFFEEINCAGDGGIYAELVRNRSFEDGGKPDHWTLMASGSARAEMKLENEAPTGPVNQKSLRLAVESTGGGRVAVANGGYWGIALKQGASYALSLYARGERIGAIEASLEGADGTVYAQRTIEGIGAQWKPARLVLTSSATDPKARLVIGVRTAGTLWLDMVSMFPAETWKGRENGLRPDLAGMLAGLRPAFVRFPGGCWVEGNTMKEAMRWKQTIGALPERRTQWNIWQYQSTNGLGQHEYLQMCEDLGADALFVINCGMSHRENIPMEKMGEFVQDALDAIEYAIGPVESKWGAARAKNGHPAPFPLKYIEVGNENGGPAYNERYAMFYDAIKAKYPQIRIVANEWSGRPGSRPVEILDEHYYSSPEFFIANADRYDRYDRNGAKIYVGEYACTQGCGQGNLRAAVGEAAFMTGMERNSDVVVMSSYAPLFANVNYKRWNPDLINFDSSRVYGTPSYHVQQMFSTSRSDVVLPLAIETPAPVVEPKPGGIGVGTWATQAEYKDIRVTQNGKTLFAADFANGAAGWKTLHGNWKAVDGAYRQESTETDVRATAGDASWVDYTYELKARKLGGAEGFLVMFQVKDENNWVWWNIGGWGNQRHALERCENGGKSILGREVGGRIEANRWYDIKVELKGPVVKCYLDGKLIHEATYAPARTLHGVAGRINATGEVVLKVVNSGKSAQAAVVSLEGAATAASAATVTVLTGDPAAENTLAEPTKVSPTTRKVELSGARFTHEFPGNSVTVMRIPSR